MANPVWPAGLPQFPQQQDYNQQTPENRISFQPDVGPAIFRPRGTKGNVPISLSVRLTPGQTVLLNDFVINTLAQGSLPFDWRDFMSTTFVLRTYVFNQGGLPTYSVVNGVQWNAAFQLLSV